ncbi:M20/M25/M40 family metallo-hydrolase [Rubrolithibacter danxiaensis]|uniref:M20/M25/M40 family metallo-hydrolase n=1 Tax=Rubrolithibacter danxiaensis TaxID=3390805 RepID=UPI003BF81A13
MKIYKRIAVLFFLIQSTAFAQTDSVFIRKIYDEALINGQCYQNLEYLCKKIGPRLSGSSNAEKAVNWTKQLMEKYGFDTIYLQEVMVPHWVRGAKETAFIKSGNEKIPVPITALGGSVATPEKGITANVIEVKNFDELRAMGEAKVKGKIVFYNRPFDPRPIKTFLSYGGAVDQRVHGAVEAAKLGAVGVIVRSMTHAIDDNPHTGTMRYDNGVLKIPAAAISTKGANLLSEKIKSGKPLTFYFKQSCRELPDAKSHNVIAEIKGTGNPKEIIAVGAHLDSWDLAEGAHDDGTGVMQSVEVLRMFKTLGYKPRHTVRAVLFVNEENGLRGGTKYAELAERNAEKHIAAIESDEGGFTPRGFAFQDVPEKVKKINENWKQLLEPYGLAELINGEAGADISPLKNTVLIGYMPDSQRYFDIHHSTSDVFENVNKRELELGAASMASLIYLIDKYGL